MNQPYRSVDGSNVLDYCDWWGSHNHGVESFIHAFIHMCLPDRIKVYQPLLFLLETLG